MTISVSCVIIIRHPLPCQLDRPSKQIAIMQTGPVHHGRRRCRRTDGRLFLSLGGAEHAGWPYKPRHNKKQRSPAVRGMPSRPTGAWHPAFHCIASVNSWTRHCSRF